MNAPLSSRFYALITLVLFSLSACMAIDPEDAGTSATNEQLYMIEAATNGLTVNLDEISDMNLYSSPNCTGRVGTVACPVTVTPIKTATYSGCTLPGTATTLTGSVRLAFTGTSCAFASSGDSVTRTIAANLDYVAPGGLTFRTWTGAAADYDGGNHSGGATLTYLGGFSWTLSVNGIHRRLFKGATTYLNITTYTSTPIGLTTSVTGSTIADALSRRSRTLNGGTLNVVHNLGLYKATVAPSNLTWASASCCYPTSGSLSFVYSGAQTGSMNVAFTGECGKISYSTDAGVTGTGTLGSCAN